MLTLEGYLKRNAETAGDRTAVVCGDSKLSYAELYSAALKRSAAFVRGRAVPFRATCSISFLVDYFAIHIAGGIAVPLGKDMPEASFNAVSDSLKGADIAPEVADILFTTGTTGKSKGVMVSHSAIVADAENLIAAQGFSRDLTFIVCGPLNHIGSLSKIYPVILSGAAVWLVDGLKTLQDFYSAIDKSETKVASFLVPASLRILMKMSPGELAERGPKIDFIETGAAPMSQDDMDRLCGLLPSVRLYNTYASPATGIIATHNFNGSCREAGCLGRPMMHSQIVITPEGLISCQGATLMSGYVSDPELTASILRDGTLYTGDRGYLDAEGRLRLSGRSDDVINIGGFKVAPTEVEDAALSMPGVKDCVCICASHPVLEKCLKLLVVTDEGLPLDKRALAAYLSTKLESYKVPLMYSQVEKVERTFNGKINRKYYL